VIVLELPRAPLAAIQFVRQPGRPSGQQQTTLRSVWGPRPRSMVCPYAPQRAAAHVSPTFGGKKPVVTGAASACQLAASAGINPQAPAQSSAVTRVRRAVVAGFVERHADHIARVVIRHGPPLAGYTSSARNSSALVKGDFHFIAYGDPDAHVQIPCSGPSLIL